jgi:ribosome modulation factor
MDVLDKAERRGYRDGEDLHQCSAPFVDPDQRRAYVRGWIAGVTDRSGRPMDERWDDVRA